MTNVPSSEADARELQDLRDLLAEQIARNASLEQALELERSKHASLTECVPWVVAKLSRDLHYLDVNSYFTAILGSTQEELRGTSLGLHGEGSDWCEMLRDFAASEGEQEREIEFIFVHEGRTRQFLAHLSRSCSQTGELLVFAHDQTERKLALLDAHESARAAQAASRAKAEFLAVMSHEIRTPLNGLLGMASLLLDTPLNEEQHGLVATLNSSGTSLLHVVNNLLDLSKVESGELSFQHAPFDLATLLNEVLDMYRAQSMIQEVKLVPEVSARADRRPVGEPRFLRQALMNLVGNALKFTERGHVKIRAKLNPRSSCRAQLLLEVEDTGIGIPPARLDDVFRPFVQADASTTRSHGGAGLGLSITQRLVQAMDGTISVTSEQGRGTTMTIRLEVGLDQAQRKAAPTRSTAESVADLRVLVAEDNPVNRRVADGFLRREGCEVHSVCDGQAAYEAALGQPFDLILMDIEMPVLDGLGATARIRESAAEIGPVRIVAMTANAIQGDRETCLAAGMDGYLSKPFSREQLLEVLRAATPQAEGTPEKPWLAA